MFVICTHVKLRYKITHQHIFSSSKAVSAKLKVLRNQPIYGGRGRLRIIFKNTLSFPKKKEALKINNNIVTQILFREAFFPSKALSPCKEPYIFLKLYYSFGLSHTVIFCEPFPRPSSPLKEDIGTKEFGGKARTRGFNILYSSVLWAMPPCK